MCKTYVSTAGFCLWSFLNVIFSIHLSCCIYSLTNARCLSLCNLDVQIQNLWGGDILKVEILGEDQLMVPCVAYE